MSTTPFNKFHTKEEDVYAPLLPSQQSGNTNALTVESPRSARSTSAAQQQLQIAAMEENPHRVFMGMLFFACSTIFVTLMGTCAKLLTQHGIPVFQIVLARSVAMFVLCVPYLVKQKANPLGNRRWLLLMRSILGFGSVSSIFWTVNFLTLSDATVLSFLAPLFVALTAPVLLNEPPSRTAIFAIPVCLAGVILVAHPSFIFGGGSVSDIGVAIGVSQAFFSATAKMSVRALRSSEKDPVIVIWMATMSILGSTLFCILLPNHFQMPQGWAQWLLHLAVGLAGFGNQVCMTAGLRRCPATPAIGLSYLSVVWGLGLGAAVFGERPSVLSLSGGALICACTAILSFAEASSKRKAAAKKVEPVGDEEGGYQSPPLIDESVDVEVEAVETRPLLSTLSRASSPVENK